MGFGEKNHQNADKIIDIVCVMEYYKREVIKMTFGERVLKYMKEAGLNQRQLAERIGVTPTRLNYWIKDKREPEVYYIKELARVLGVSGDALIGTEEPQSEPSDILYISRPTGNADTDELRRQLHDFIDQLSDDDLRVMSVMIKFNREG